MRALYFAFGDVDAFAIGELPDNLAAAAAALDGAVKMRSPTVSDFGRNTVNAAPRARQVAPHRRRT